MFKQISDTEVVQQKPEECKQAFQTLDSGDSVILTARNGSDTYIKARFIVGATKQNTSESDDYVNGEIEGESAKLKLPWGPAEPEVGIPEAYPQMPVQLKYTDELYEVSSLLEEAN